MMSVVFVIVALHPSQRYISYKIDDTDMSRRSEEGLTYCRTSM